MKLKLRPLLSAVRTRRTGTSHIQPWLQPLFRDAALCRRFQSQASTPKTSEPLRILFCGSDEFSVANLRAIYDEHVKNPSLIESIDVVIRPGKRVGRGYKKIQHPPLREFATELNLPIHERDTFTGWSMPSNINLIIAVSFGLFVPPRLLRGAKYGGLNVHPSLLPEFRGPAPLHHTLLAGRRTTGVTLQTLDDKTFDAGVILAQTPLDDAYQVPQTYTVPELQAALTPLATHMLVQSLREGRHVHPQQAVGWTLDKRHLELGADDCSKYKRVVDGLRSHDSWESADVQQEFAELKKSDPSLAQTIFEAANLPDGNEPAPKITSTLRQLVGRPRSGVWTARTAVHSQRIIGPLWFMARDLEGKTKRVIVEGELREVTSQEGKQLFQRPGKYHRFKIYRLMDGDTPDSAKPEFDAFIWAPDDETENVYLVDRSNLKSGEHAIHTDPIPVVNDGPDISIYDVCQSALEIRQLKIEGGKVKPAKVAFAHLSLEECQLQDILSAHRIPYYLDS
ncbi:formyl transferase [Truncatella angustata]|uniref:methionyl-tRNA formyltransferase n=1 Tax=Truncatella angustata TaxID=152316 RepID=A0A9P8UP30_9PEZI|nr:formyl transferase [Truncatella angustata]KAH6655610.1 formyl transferase [Truncatella angustata]KAH8197801.1 hypothetical protein TruAng_008048 [Truncatella angustata]